jgi:hypothetical protein
VRTGAQQARAGACGVRCVQERPKCASAALHAQNAWCKFRVAGSVFCISEGACARSAESLAQPGEFCALAVEKPRAGLGNPYASEMKPSPPAWR